MQTSTILLPITKAHEARAGAKWTQPYLQLLRIARAAADGKGAGHMVPKGGVVGMLLDGHQLYGVVAQLCNSGQHAVCTRALRWLVTLYVVYIYIVSIEILHKNMTSLHASVEHACLSSQSCCF